MRTNGILLCLLFLGCTAFAIPTTHLRPSGVALEALRDRFAYPVIPSTSVSAPDAASITVTENIAFPGTPDAGVTAQNYLLTLRIDTDGEWEHSAFAIVILLGEGMEVNSHFAVMLDATNDGEHVSAIVRTRVKIGDNPEQGADKELEFDQLWLQVCRSGNDVYLLASTKQEDPKPEDYFTLGKITFDDEKIGKLTNWPRIVAGDGFVFSHAKLEVIEDKKSEGDGSVPQKPK